MLLRAPALLWRGCSEPYKTLAGVVQNTHRSMSGIQRATKKTMKNTAPQLLGQGFLSRARENEVLERSGLDFEGVWGRLGQLLANFWTLLGVSWVLLGTFWALLGASWTLLGVSWLIFGASWVHFGFQGRPEPRLWKVWGRAGLSFGGLQGHVLACLLLRPALRYIMLLLMQ